jgi:hypothetical protein
MNSQAAEAIKALDRVDAATRVGVNIGKYHDLVAEALVAVEEAQRSLPEGPLKAGLKKIMTAYQDAGVVWSFRLRWPDLYLSDKLGHTDIVDRYELRAAGRTEYGELRVNSEVAQQIIWQTAADALKAVKAMQ